MQKLYSIGEFSKLTNISIDTLRYYDKIGLLRPEQTDADSSYRYYSQAQLVKLDIIKICRNVGISLEQTSGLFAKGDPFSFEKSLGAQREVLDTKIRALEQSRYLLEQLISKLRVFEEVSAYSGFYSRELPARNIAVASQPVAYSNMDLDNSKVYVTLSQEMRRQGILESYEGGFIYGLDGGAITGATVFECVPQSLETEALALAEIAGGRFFCMNYSEASREATLAMYLEEINRLGLSPRCILDVYLVDGCFRSTDRRFELQCHDERADV